MVDIKKILLFLVFCSFFFAAAFLFVLPTHVAHAAHETTLEAVADTDEEQGVLSMFAERIVETWNSPTYDLYIPLYTWHNRLMYDQHKIDSYNEKPWGIGFGRSFYDEDGDWHALYGMGFQDSHDMFEPIVGYGFQKNWKLDDEGDWRAGVGYTLGVTARHEYDYIPLPLPLPMVGLEYKRLALQAVYIPGLYNNGNVMFLWARWQLND